MNRLKANYIASDLTRTLVGDVPGEVHSVFNAAINIWHNNRLFTILAPRRCVHPKSLVLDSSPAFDTLPIAVHMPVRMKGGVLTIGVSEEETAISFENAAAIDLSLGSRTALCRPSNIMERAAAVVELVAGLENAQESIAALLKSVFPAQVFAFPANVYCQFLAERVDRFMISLRAFDTQACAQLAGELAGCGQGLTPSSDDLLTGMFAAVYGSAAAGQLDRRQAARMCKPIAQNAAPRTNLISAGFLESSAAGLFSEDVLMFMEQFYSNGPLELLCNAARTIAAFGSTSGMDILTGFCLGVAAMESVIKRNPADSLKQQPK